MKEADFSHVSADNQVTMVDVSQKQHSQRTARASARVELTNDICALLQNRDLHLPKGPVFQTAILAGIMGAKKTADLIPLCHSMPIDSVTVNIEMDNHTAVITSEVKTFGKTGVEMEALTAVSVAALTVYDMCKALSHDITISSIQLLEKTGGKSDFHRHA
jgi:cyclic pyranopterin phosphate synthase